MIERSKEWWMKKAEQEGTSEVGAGAPSPSAKSKAKDRSWIRGYGAALAEMLRVGHDGQSAAAALRAANVGLSDLAEAGLSGYDLNLIRNHIEGRS